MRPNILSRTDIISYADITVVFVFRLFLTPFVAMLLFLKAVIVRYILDLHNL